MPGRRNRSFADRFWSKVEKSDGCWTWMAALHESGYGIIGLGGRGAGVDRAHRVSWRMHFGEIPKGMFVCHRCDNPKCVRPEHLFLGTAKDNSDDKWKKGRATPPPRLLGDANPKSHAGRLRRGDLVIVRDTIGRFLPRAS